MVEIGSAPCGALRILTHVPSVYRAPGDRVQWAMLFYALAIAGSAWLVAATFGDRHRTD